MAAAVGYASSTHRISRWHKRVATSPTNSRASETSRFHGSLRSLQHAFEPRPEFRAVNRIGQRELDERFEIAREIPDVVSLFARGQLERQHPPPLFAHLLDGVGKLYLAAMVGLH